MNNDVKVENGTVKGDEVVFTGDFVFKGGKTYLKQSKKQCLILNLKL